MNWKKYSLVAIICFFAQHSQATVQIDPQLVDFLKQGNTSKAQVIVLMGYDVLQERPTRYSAPAVTGYLKRAMALNSQRLGGFLKSKISGSQDLKIESYFWINNSVFATVTPQGLRHFLQAPGVTKIYLNRKITYDRPFRSAQQGGSFAQAYPYDLKDMEIDKVRAQFPQVTGAGVVIGSVDTGVDGTHPLLKDKILRFYDAVAKKQTAPFDRDQHGTHTVGTMVGGDTSTNLMGVAPGAKVIATAALTDYDVVIRGMEYMLDPDGNPATNDLPRAVSNSWNCGGAPDMEVFYRAISAWEAAGILPIFSAGNAGPRAKSITPPHEHPATIAIGATGVDSKIAPFSSRGSATYKGQEIAKPDFTAPGVDIVSTIPGGKTAAFSGTSMATPHVTGLVALLYQLQPQLNPMQMREVLMKSLVMVDANGNPQESLKWNLNYGYGRVNALKAVTLLMKAKALGSFAEILSRVFRVETGIEHVNVGEFNPLVGSEDHSSMISADTL